MYRGWDLAMGNAARLDKAKRIALSHVVPDFGVVTRKTSEFSRRKCLWQERSPWRYLTGYQKPW